MAPPGSRVATWTPSGAACHVESTAQMEPIASPADSVPAAPPADAALTSADDAAPDAAADGGAHDPAAEPPPSGDAEPGAPADAKSGAPVRLTTEEAEAVFDRVCQMRKSKVAATVTLHGWRLEYKMRSYGTSGDFYATDPRGGTVVRALCGLRRRLGLRSTEASSSAGAKGAGSRKRRLEEGDGDEEEEAEGGEPVATVASPPRVGERIEVFWPLDDAWYAATVLSERSGLHALRYAADGSSERLDLTQEAWRRGAAAGQRIEVYWPLDSAWYAGTVLSERAGRHTVRYDADGVSERIDLAGEKWRHRACAGDAIEVWRGREWERCVVSRERADGTFIVRAESGGGAEGIDLSAATWRSCAARAAGSADGARRAASSRAHLAWRCEQDNDDDNNTTAHRHSMCRHVAGASRRRRRRPPKRARSAAPSAPTAPRAAARSRAATRTCARCAGCRRSTRTSSSRGARGASPPACSTSVGRCCRRHALCLARPS